MCCGVARIPEAVLILLGEALCDAEACCASCARSSVGRWASLPECLQARHSALAILGRNSRGEREQRVILRALLDLYIDCRCSPHSDVLSRKLPIGIWSLQPFCTTSLEGVGP